MDIAVRITDSSIPIASNVIGATFLIEQGGVTKQVDISVLSLGISGSVKQFEVVNPLVVSSGGIETWTFPNTLYDKYAQCQIYENATDSRLNAIGNKVTDTEISFIFYTGTDIPANTYRCCVQGIQKDEPTPPTSDYVEDDYVEGDYVL